jgi:hypothetical protein
LVRLSVRNNGIRADLKEILTCKWVCVALSKLGFVVELGRDLSAGSRSVLRASQASGVRRKAFMSEILEIRYEQHPEVVFRRIADEAILVPTWRQTADFENLYALSDTGARIWQLIDGRRSLAQVCEQMIQEYDADADEIVADVTEFVQHLEGVGVLRRIG